MVVVLLALSAVLISAVPTLISYQGKLNNATTGDPFTLASVRINITEVGDLNSVIWNYTFNNVTDQYGVFSIVLGRNLTLNLTPGREYQLVASIDLGSAEYLSPDVIYGDLNPGGDDIRVSSGGPSDATELYLSDNSTTVEQEFGNYIKKTGGNFTGTVTYGGFTNISSLTGNINSSANISAGLFFGNGTFIQNILCSNIVGLPDTDFCTDASGAGAFSEAGILGNITTLNETISRLNNTFNSSIRDLNNTLATKLGIAVQNNTDVVLKSLNITEDLNVTGNVSIGGNLSISGNLNITGTGKINCQLIDGGTDANFCTDTGGDVTEIMSNLNSNITSLNQTISRLNDTFNASINNLNNSIGRINYQAYESNFSSIWNNLNSNMTSLNVSIYNLNLSLSNKLEKAVQNNTDVVLKSLNITEDLNVSGNVSIGGNLSISGNLNITGTGKINCQLIDGGTDTNFCTDTGGDITEIISNLNSNITSLNQTISRLNDTFNASIRDLNNSIGRINYLAYESNFSSIWNNLNSNITSLNVSINNLNLSLSNKLEKALQNNTDAVLKSLNITEDLNVTGNVSIGGNLSISGNLNITGTGKINCQLIDGGTDANFCADDAGTGFASNENVEANYTKITIDMTNNYTRISGDIINNYTKTTIDMANNYTRISGDIINNYTRTTVDNANNFTALKDFVDKNLTVINNNLSIITHNLTQLNNTVDIIKLNNITNLNARIISINNSANFSSLTIDSGTLYVDAGNNRVGIGTTNPNVTLEINGGILRTGSYAIGTATNTQINLGSNSTTSGNYSTISGGRYNSASGHFATISGGESNNATGNHSTVSGGKNNTAAGYFATVGGGANNNATGNYTSIIGGYNNTAKGNFSAVLGGENNTASGPGSLAAGKSANASDSNSVVFGLLESGSCQSTAASQFKICADQLKVEGNANISGNLNVTGSINAYNITNLNDRMISVNSSIGSFALDSDVENNYTRLKDFVDKNATKINASYMTIDSGTLYVDAGRNFVGVGTSNPTARLYVTSSDGAAVLNVSGGTGASSGYGSKIVMKAGRGFDGEVAGGDGGFGGDVEIMAGDTGNTATGIYAGGSIVIIAGNGSLDVNAGGGPGGPGGQVNISGGGGEDGDASATGGTGGNVYIKGGDGGSGGSKGLPGNVILALNSGKVGIGTNNDPAQTLTVQGSMNVSGNVNVTGNLNVSGNVSISKGYLNVSQGMTVDKGTLYVDAGNNRVGIGTSAPTAALYIDGSPSVVGTVGDGPNAPSFHIAGAYSGTGQLMSINNWAGTRVFTVVGNGHIGIGALDPSQTLTVQGSVNVSGNLNVSGNQSINNSIWVTGPGKIAIGVNYNDNVFRDPGQTLTVQGNANISGNLNVSGNLNLTKSLRIGEDIDIVGGDINTGTLRFGTLTSSGTYEFEDGSVCVGDGGCAADASNDGRLIVEGAIAVGATANQAYNIFGTGTKGQADIADANDVYISDDLEVDGIAYLAGGVYWTQGDIAEDLHTVKSREADLCSRNPDCFSEYNETELDYGDVICINDQDINQTINICNSSNSHLVAGVISNTSVLIMSPKEHGYPVSVSGLVYTKVTNMSGNIEHGDLLVSSSKPGFAMKNNNPEPGTTIGKSFGSCNEEECIISIFIALS